MTALTTEQVSVERIIDLTRAMVSQDSRNLLEGANERGAADAARQLIEPLGANFTEVEPIVNRTSLLATLHDHDSSRPTLIVNGHLDVVPVNFDAWTKDPFACELDTATNKLYGRGTTDMKGGIAASIHAIEQLRANNKELSCNVVFHLVADEERGGTLGTKVLYEQGLIKGDACLIPEPTDLQICLAERGLFQANLTVHGKPAHGSQPRTGISAIEHAASIVLALHAKDFGNTPHPLLGIPSCNIGLINGGSAFNVVSETCVIGIDRRVIPGETEQSVQADIEDRVAALGLSDLNYDIEVKFFGEPSELVADHPFIGLVEEAILDTGLDKPSHIGMSFTTDARFVRNNAHVPAIVCGPGAISQAHVDDEFVEVGALVSATQAYAHLFTTFNSTYGPL